jgi:hypothetical protein
LIGTLNRSEIEIAIPPLAVPSILVRANGADELKPDVLKKLEEQNSCENTSCSFGELI